VTCIGDCGKVYGGVLRTANDVVIEVCCEDCFRRDFPERAAIAGFTGFTIDGWRLTVERI
jgi:hypothetical protein